MNKAAYGPGQGAISFDKVGPWRTQITDPMQMGAPFVVSPGTYDWATEYGVLYKVTICGGGGGGGSAGLNNGGGAGGAVQFWWVGTGERASISVGGAGGGGSNGTGSSFTVGGKTLVNAAGGQANGTGGSNTIDASLTGKSLSIPGNNSIGGFSMPCIGAPSGFGLGTGGNNLVTNAQGYGAGGGGDPSGGAVGTNGANGVCIIEKVLPALNSQGGPWAPTGNVLGPQ